MESLKTKTKAWIQLTKEWIIDNKLRTGAVLCMLLVLISFFAPFISAKADVSIKGIGNNTLEIVTPNSNIMGTNLGDFVLQKPIDEVTFLNFKLGDLQLFGRPILDVLRTSMPDKGLISNVENALNSSALDFLIDPNVQSTIEANFERGKDINNILTGAWNIAQNSKIVVSGINNVTMNARDSMDQVNAVMETVDQYKMMINNFVLVLFGIAIGLLVVLFLKKVPTNVLITLSAILFFVFLIIGIGVFIVNAQVNAQVSALLQQLNANVMSELKTILEGILGNIGSFVTNLLGAQGNFLSMAFFVQLDFGYWLILLGSGASFVLTILLKRKDKSVVLELDTQESTESNDVEVL